MVAPACLPPENAQRIGGGRTNPTNDGSSDLGWERAKPAGGRHAVVALRWSARLLVAVSWVSGAIFAACIIAFFGGAAIGGAGAR